MYAPRTRERVQLVGRRGVFLVIWVDYERQEADLIPLHDAMSSEESISFSDLEPYRENIPHKST